MARPLMDLSWQADSACAGLPPNWWLVDDHEDPDPEAVETCRVCPVMGACRHHALLFEEYGFWALLTADQRRQQRRILGIRLFDSPATARREAVVAYWQEGMPAAQIAQELGIHVRYVWRDLADSDVKVTEDDDWRRGPRNNGTSDSEVAVAVSHSSDKGIVSAA